MAGRGLLVGLHEVPEVPKDGVHMLRGGLDEECPRVLPDLVAQASAAVLDGGARGCRLRALQAARVEQLCHARCALLCQERR
jgi:hypothetical protein